MAKSIVGSASGAAASSAVREVAKASCKDAERKMHDILARYELALPVALTGIKSEVASLDGFPRLKPLDFLRALRDKGHLNKLLGGKSLQSSRQMLCEFWENYKHMHPDFTLFREDADLGQCVPILAHIDGGRGYKRSEFMVFNWCAVLGNGTGAANKKDHCVQLKRSQNHQMQVSLLGHSFLTHYLYAAMPASYHKSDEELFQEILRIFALDLRECFDESVSHSGGHLRLVLLGLKGDLKLQARAGIFTAWYSTARKGPINPAKPSKTSGRCCPWCPAGCVEAPYEELHSESPAWRRLQQQGDEGPPWVVEGGMLGPSFRYKDPATFYFPDLFHIYLAGVGQDFAASALVYMLPLTFQGGGSSSVEAQITVLNLVFKQWRAMQKKSTNLTSFTRNILNYPDATKTFPTGTWSKASDTPKIISFILYVLELWPELCAEDKICFYIRSACRSIGIFMRGLYEADMWIEPWFYQYDL